MKERIRVELGVLALSFAISNRRHAHPESFNEARRRSFGSAAARRCVKTFRISAPF
jgi:hypothetical protein